MTNRDAIGDSAPPSDAQVTGSHKEETNGLLQLRFVRSGFLGDAAAFGTIVAALLYAWGWLIVARLLDAFDVDPEEIGLGFSSLVVRVAPAALLLAGVAYFLMSTASRIPSLHFDIEISRSARSYLRFARDILGILASLSSALAALFGVLSDLTAAGRLLNSPVFTWFLSLAPIAFGLLLAAWRQGSSSRPDTSSDVGAEVTSIARGHDSSEGSRERPDSGVSESRKMRMSFVFDASVVTAVARWVVPLSVATVVLLAPFLVGSYAANSIKAGRSVHLSSGFPFITGLRVVPVEVTVDGESKIAPETCMLRLGSADGVVVLYEPQQGATYRVAVEKVVLAGGHRGDCA